MSVYRDQSTPLAARIIIAMLWFYVPSIQPPPDPIRHLLSFAWLGATCLSLTRIRNHLLTSFHYHYRLLFYPSSSLLLVNLILQRLAISWWLTNPATIPVLAFPLLALFHMICFCIFGCYQTTGRTKYRSTPHRTRPSTHARGSQHIHPSEPSLVVDD